MTKNYEDGLKESRRFILEYHAELDSDGSVRDFFNYGVFEVKNAFSEFVDEKLKESLKDE